MLLCPCLPILVEPKPTFIALPCARVAGEDPFLAAEYVAHFVSGIQGTESDPVYDAKWAKGIATCKHYDAYSLENFTHFVPV